MGKKGGERMTRQEAIEILRIHKEFFGEEIETALNMAIESLEQAERMEDDVK